MVLKPIYPSGTRSNIDTKQKELIALYERVELLKKYKAHLKETQFGLADTTPSFDAVLGVWATASLLCECVKASLTWHA